MTQPISKGLLVFMAIFHVAILTHAFPVRTNNTISNPCGRDLTATGTPTFLPLVQEIRLSIAAFHNVDRETRTTMTKYETLNLLTAAEVTRLTSPISNLQDLPTRQSSDYSELASQLRQDYHDISIFLVYLQHSQTQQLVYDGNLLERELHNVNQALHSVLCRMETLLRQRGTRPNHFVDSSVIPSDLQNMRESKDRYSRDFVLLKDIKAYVEAMSTDYEDLFGRLSGED